MWDNAAEAVETFAQDDFVRVKGLMQVFQNRHSSRCIKFSRWRKRRSTLPILSGVETRPGRNVPGVAGLDRRDDESAPEVSAGGDVRGRGNRPGFPHGSRAKAIHHAWIGGLIEHVLSLCTLAKFTAAHYANIDFDLLLTGVILHDIGKISELKYARSFSYSTEVSCWGIF